MLRDHVDDDGTRRWLHTGDLGYLDADGYVFIVDRKKDLIKTSGYQVWPREIEEVLATHPAVAEVGVAGVADDVKGEAVKAWVVLRAGQTATEADLRAFCREKLAPYKVPSRIEFRTELPKTMVGKVLRRALRRQRIAVDDCQLPVARPGRAGGVGVQRAAAVGSQRTCAESGPVRRSRRRRWSTRRICGWRRAIRCWTDRRHFVGHRCPLDAADSRRTGPRARRTEAVGRHEPRHAVRDARRRRARGRDAPRARRSAVPARAASTPNRRGSSSCATSSA